MAGLKTLAVVVTVKGGARWEPEDRSGWSHLLEHLVFKGAGDMAARRESHDDDPSRIDPVSGCP